MTFPTIPTVAAGRVLTTNQADTSATRTFPDLSSLTKNSGDLLIAIIVAYQSSTTDAQFSSWGGGFTEFHDTGTSSTLAIGMAYKWSTGSETGTFTVTQAATITGHASMILLSIPGAHATTPPEAGSRVSGTSAAADPGSFNPGGWGTEDTLWISVVGSGMTASGGAWTATGTTAPSNYTDRVDSNTTDDSTVGQSEVAVAFQQLNAASEDVGTAGVDTSNARNAAVVIAVRPAPTTHATSGALSAGAGALAGTAARTRVHATTGVLAGPGAVLDGTAARSGGAVTHETSGALSAGAGTLAGAAARDHFASGALSAGTGTLAGTAVHLRPHDTTGALEAGTGTLSGAAARDHFTSGALTAGTGTLSGSAARTRVHATTGALDGPGAVLDGSAARSTPGQPHVTSGDLAGPGATLSGAARIATHHSTGALAGTGAALAGVAARTRTHTVSGDLAGAGTVLVGAAALHKVHATAGTMAGAGAALVGSASRVEAGFIEHSTAGALGGTGASLLGAAIIVGPKGYGTMSDRSAGGSLSDRANTGGAMGDRSNSGTMVDS